MINASEIGDFVYCKRSWWLARNNYFGRLTPEQEVRIASRLEPGVLYHIAHASNVRMHAKERTSRRIILFVIALLLAAAVVVILLGVPAHGSALNTSTAHRVRSDSALLGTAQQRQAASWEIPALTLIAMASVAFAIAYFLVLKRSRIRERHWQIPQRELVYVGNDQAEILKCPDLGLQGVPDAIWKEGTFYVPEE